MSKLLTISAATSGPSQLAPQSASLVATLGNRVFSPLAQSQLLQFPSLAYSDRSGRRTIRQLVETYGRAAVIMSLQAALVDVARFMGGSAEPQTIAEVAGQCAGIICSDYYGLKPSEVSLFCARIKRGDYGREFAFTGAGVMSAFRKFKRERDEERYRLQRQEESERMRQALNSPAVVTDPDALERITSLIKTTGGRRDK